MNKIDSNLAYKNAVNFFSELQKATDDPKVAGKGKAKGVGHFGYFKGKIVARCENSDQCAALRQKMCRSLAILIPRKKADPDAEHMLRNLSASYKKEKGVTSNDLETIRGFLDAVRGTLFGGGEISCEQDFGFGHDEFTDQDIEEARHATTGPESVKAKLKSYGNISPSEKRLRLLADDITSNIVRAILVKAPRYPSESLIKAFGSDRKTIAKNVLKALKEEFELADPVKGKKAPAKKSKTSGKGHRLSQERLKFLKTCVEGRLVEGADQLASDAILKSIKSALKGFTNANKCLEGNKKSGVVEEFFRAAQGGAILLHAKLNGKSLIADFGKRMTDAFKQTETYKAKLEGKEFNSAGGIKLIHNDGEEPYANVSKSTIDDAEVGKVLENIMTAFPDDSFDCEGMMWVVTTMLSHSCTSSYPALLENLTLDLGLGSCASNQADGISESGCCHELTDIETDISIKDDKVTIVQKFPLGSTLASLGGVSIPETQTNRRYHTVTMSFPISENRGLEVGKLPAGFEISTKMTCDADYV